jgi:DNA mismatch endonuclease (patch repair protein)
VISRPSFAAYRSCSEASSKTKRANRGRDTTHERLLRSELFLRGMRFRKNVKTLLGTPDIVFPKAKTVVFCDGDFWHGRDWTRRKVKLQKGSNSKYWVQKIEHNRQRDKLVTRKLRTAGWRVVRVWETDILNDVATVANSISELLDRSYS